MGAASLEYGTSFDWQSVTPPQLRRAARTPVERLEMRVAFTPGRLPADLQWALSDGYAPGARLRRPNAWSSTAGGRRTGSPRRSAA